MNLNFNVKKIDFKMIAKLPWSNKKIKIKSKSKRKREREESVNLYTVRHIPVVYSLLFAGVHVEESKTVNGDVHCINTTGPTFCSCFVFKLNKDRVKDRD